MNYLSVCSGIEAATTAWHDLGFNPVAFSEIDEFPSAVLRYRFPSVTNLGDMCAFQEWSFEQPINLLVGGTPCQSFSVAGLRRGLDDARGNLALVYLGILNKFRPKWFIWENVPGALSSNGGRDFATFLKGLGIIGYRYAYRVLDSQYFGLAQRRKRLFVVGHVGDWRGPAAVLFEPDSVCGYPTPGNTQGPKNQPSPTSSSGECYKPWPAQVTGTLTAAFGKKLGYEYQHINNGCTMFVPGIATTAGTLRTNRPGEGGRETDATHIVPILSPTICSGQRLNTPDKEAYITSSYGSTLNYLTIRRLTPIECERLQGFPDNHTKIPYRGKVAESCPDGPRYKAIGNSMSVPVMRWIGRRIKQVDLSGLV